MKDLNAFMLKENVTIKHNIKYRKSEDKLTALKDNTSRFYTHNFINKDTQPLENDVSENFSLINLEQEVEELKKEVLKSKKKKQKRFILMVVSTVLMMNKLVSSSILGSPMTAFATSEAIPAEVSVNGSATEMIKVILDTLNTLLPQFRSLALTVGTLLLILVGVLQMLRRKELVTGWVDDIIKGLVQVLIAPMVVGLIYYATAHILGDSLTFSPVLP